MSSFLKIKNISRRLGEFSRINETLHDSFGHPAIELMRKNTIRSAMTVGEMYPAWTGEGNAETLFTPS